MKTCIKCGSNEFYERGDCAPCARANAKQWRLDNKERAAEAYKKWAAKNKERISETYKRWREKNMEEANKHNRAYRAKYPERARAASDNWKKANPEAAAAIKENRRCRIMGQGGTFTKDDVFKLRETQGDKCAVCRKDISAKRHIDHIMPIALGGSNNPDNLQLLCPPCNHRKAAKHPEVFMREVAEALC